jgi:hypothetical protein
VCRGRCVTAEEGVLLQTGGEVGGKNEKKSARMEWKWRHIKVIHAENDGVHEYWCLSCAIWKQKNETAAGPDAANSHKYGKYQPTICSPTHIGVNFHALIQRVYSYVYR